MKEKLEYKGHFGTVEYDTEANIFHGEIIINRDVITFQGETIKKTKKAFEDSINDYISWCKEEDEKNNSFNISNSLKKINKKHGKTLKKLAK